MAHAFKIHIEEVVQGFVVNVNGLEYEPTTLIKSLSLVRGIHKRFNEKYPIMLTDSCNFHLTSGEKAYASNKSDMILYY